mgnify:CR=1 FL=1
MSDVTPQSASSKSTLSQIAASEGLRNPDAVQEKLLAVGSWIEKNVRLLAGLLALIIVLVIGYIITDWFNVRAERKTQEAYYALEAKYAKIKDGFDRAQLGEIAAAGSSIPKPQQPTGDLRKDYGAIPNELETFARENAGTVAGAQAAILAANLYLTYRQPEKAVEIAQIPATKLSEKRLIANLAKILWGSALADKGECSEAIKVWGEVLNNSAMTSLHADAALRTGLCYETLNQPDKAKEFYQKVMSISEDSSAASTAKGLLRALEIKSPAAGNG